MKRLKRNSHEKPDIRKAVQWDRESAELYVKLDGIRWVIPEWNLQANEKKHPFCWDGATRKIWLYEDKDNRLPREVVEKFEEDGYDLPIE